MSVELGVGKPFEPLPSQSWPIQTGLQGGFHIDVSVRAQGALDPDHTDVELILSQGEVVRARHITADWLLHLDTGFCEYPLARMVMVDEQNDLFPRERLAELTGEPLSLSVKLSSPQGGGQQTLPVRLTLP